ncbi:MAG TPA: hypothetical protein VI685_19960 [Candidatus Angelobacter sp.]
MRTQLMATIFLILICASCSSKSTTPGSSFTASSRPGHSDPRNDYTTPYLSDEKITRLIDSMKEEHNPFEVIFKKGGGVNTLGDMQSRLAEFNAFAQRYGFQDYQDYTAVWGRVVVGQAAIWGEGMKQDAVKMIQSTIDSAKKELQKPDLNPDMRKMYEEQVAGSEKSLADMQKPSKPALNESDLALVKKYLPQIEEASKKYN